MLFLREWLDSFVFLCRLCNYSPFTLSGVKNRCIPYKIDKNVADKYCNVEDRVLVLMISTPKRDDLVFPKVSINLVIAWTIL